MVIHVSVTDWPPTASRAAIEARAAMLASVRNFFARREVLEVETPILSGAASTDPNLASMASLCLGRKQMYLHTSPEFAMKRLLAAGSADIYQVCKVFRDGERGRLHNPEFTLLEWYRLGFDQHALMREVAELLAVLLGESFELAPEPVFLSYQDLFMQSLAVDPLADCSASLIAKLTQEGVPVPHGMTDKDSLLDLAMVSLIAPGLPGNQLTFLYNYPASQAALARLDAADPRVANRFEAMLGGMELCNGFEELQDPLQQRRRFEVELSRRAQLGLAQPPMDRRLLAALETGLPDCSGVALGLDRVLMLIMQAAHIDQVICFPSERA